MKRLSIMSEAVKVPVTARKAAVTITNSQL